jgi:hypothetical protein
VTQGTIRTLASAFGMIIAHFAFQLMFGEPNWSTAGERSYFALFAIFAVWLCVRGEFKDGS